MRLRHITEGVGLVVKGVNTTPDVGVDAIQKQAAKFGFKVDKKGKPAYTMHKKAHKNSDPNTLFNLGMAESRKEIWNEWKIMPQTIKPMGLIHKAGKGPNNRFDFKNKANNRANEDETKLSSASEIYVDMDGVLADFFGGVEKMYGVEHWKELTSDKTKDLKKEVIDRITGTDFFATLPKFKSADALIDMVKKFTGGKFSINTSPLRGDNENSGKYKKVWISNNIEQPDEIVVTGRKETYAKNKANGMPNILIDDSALVLKKIFNAGLFASDHYRTYDRSCQNSTDLSKKVINLFNGMTQTKEFCLACCDIILKGTKGEKASKVI